MPIISSVAKNINIKALLITALTGNSTLFFIAILTISTVDFNSLGHIISQIVATKENNRSNIIIFLCLAK